MFCIFQDLNPEFYVNPILILIIQEIPYYLVWRRQKKVAADKLFCTVAVRYACDFSMVKIDTNGYLDF
jgi:hypothetical protein